VLEGFSRQRKALANPHPSTPYHTHSARLESKRYRLHEYAREVVLTPSRTGPGTGGGGCGGRLVEAGGGGGAGAKLVPNLFRVPFDLLIKTGE
jgi:hypothetical protein